VLLSTTGVKTLCLFCWESSGEIYAAGLYSAFPALIRIVGWQELGEDGSCFNSASFGLSVIGYKKRVYEG
jgi:hypothetical protein